MFGNCEGSWFFSDDFPLTGCGFLMEAAARGKPFVGDASEYFPFSWLIATWGYERGDLVRVTGFVLEFVGIFLKRRSDFSITLISWFWLAAAWIKCFGQWTWTQFILELYMLHDVHASDKWWVDDVWCICGTLRHSYPRLEPVYYRTLVQSKLRIELRFTR